MPTTPTTTDYSRPVPLTEEARRKVRRADPAMTVSSALSMAEAAPGVEVEFVAQGGLADAAGIRAGGTILRLNGEPIRDTIDFFFHSAEADLEVDYIPPGGSAPRVVRIAKEYPEQDLGIEAKQFTTQQCGCNCVFCFVHQLPDNMRKSLYVKDEDYRLSFLQGSYVTGVTLKPADLERIAAQRLTPLYLSVHAVDEELRRWLLGIRKAHAILDVLDFLREHRIQVHTQVVLCPEHNDGAQLDRTLDALIERRGCVQSVAIVPLGMTKWRDGLPDLPPVTPQYARAFIRRLAPRLKAIEEQFGEPFVLLADEWHLIAGRKPPMYAKWPDLPQLENGVGMVYHFYKDLADAKRLLRDAPPRRPWRVGAVTSTLSVPVLEKIVAACADAGLEVVPLPTINHTFGETIHVTGLLCGADIRRTIDSNPGFDQYLLPGNCLRKYDQRFLDDLTLDELRAATGVRIDPVLGGAYDFAATILEAAAGIEHAPVQDHAFLAPHWSNS